MAQSETKNVRPMPLRLDNRDQKERAVIQHYERIFVGRRNDFLRTCLIAGYEKLHGPIPDNSSMFGELSSVSYEPAVVMDKESEIQDKVIENQPEITKNRPTLMGLIGNQS